MSVRGMSAGQSGLEEKSSRRSTASVRGALALLMGFVLVVGLAVPAYAVSTFTAAPAPAISGTAAVGATLTANTGAWSPAPDSFAYQWNRNGTAITGATAKTYKLITADGGSNVTVKVTASKTGYTPTAKTSAAKTIPAQAFTTVPTPVISGTVTAGAVLTAQPGSWAPAPTSFTYQWYRDGTLSGIGATYTVRDADEGTSLIVKATATRSGYQTTSRTSQPLTIDIPDVIRYRQNADVTGNTDWLLPATRLVIAEAGITIGYGTILRVGPGVTVKIGSGNVTVLGTLRAKGSSTAPAVLTSLKDDTTAGDSNGDGTTTTAVADDWGAIEVHAYGEIDVYKARITFGSGIFADGYPNDWDEPYWPQLVQIVSSVIDGDVVAFDLGSTTTVSVSSNDLGGDLRLTNGADRATGNRIAGVFSIANEFDPSARHANNTLTGAIREIWLCATLLSDWTVPTDGTRVIFFGAGVYDSGAYGGGLNVPSGVTLTIPAGATVLATSGEHYGWGYYWDEDEYEDPADHYTYLTVRGRIVSTATSAKRVTLTTLSGSCVDIVSYGDYWGGVRALPGSTVDLRNIDQRCVLPSTPFTSAPAPVITGAGSVGSELVADPGTWSPEPDAITYQWQRDGAPIRSRPSQHQNSYVVAPTDAGKSITVNVTAYRRGHLSTSRTSAPVKIPAAAFTNVTLPVVTGDARVGSPLKASTGTWSPPSSSFTYQWYKNGEVIPDAHGSTFTPWATELGYRISATVTVTDAAGATVSATSSPTSAISPAEGVVRIPAGSTPLIALTKEASPVVIVDGDVEVRILQIGPGVVIKFATDAGIRVDTLSSQGTSSWPIVFTSLKDDSYAGDSNGDGAITAPFSRDWEGIEITDGEARVAFTRVLYGFGIRSYFEVDSGWWHYASNVAIEKSIIDGNINVRASWATVTGNAVRGDGALDRVRSRTGISVTIGRNDEGGDQLSGGQIVVSGNSLSGWPGIAVAGTYLLPSQLAGNTIAGGGYLQYTGRLGENWAITPAGLATVIASSLEVPPGRSITVAAGTVIKFSSGSLVVKGSLVTSGTPAHPVTLTSFRDDSIGGDTNADRSDTAPAVGDWQDVRVASGATADLASTTVKYASVVYE